MKIVVFVSSRVQSLVLAYFIFVFTSGCAYSLYESPWEQEDVENQFIHSFPTQSQDKTVVDSSKSKEPSLSTQKDLQFEANRDLIRHYLKTDQFRKACDQILLIPYQKNKASDLLYFELIHFSLNTLEERISFPPSDQIKKLSTTFLKLEPLLIDHFQCLHTLNLPEALKLSYIQDFQILFRKKM